jgi:predicted metal-dependent peptidase
METHYENKETFFSLVDQVSLSLMEDKDNFYSYFLMQMSREIRFDLSSPTAVSFQGTRYVIYFNPLLFLDLGPKQMASTIKHEILHILSLHLIRAKELKGRYSKLALHMAMDIVVNTYLDDLPPYALTLQRVNAKFDLTLQPYNSFEYYAEMIQTELDLLEADAGETDQADESAVADSDETATPEVHPEKAHDLWDASSEMDERTLLQFTEKFIEQAQKGSVPAYIGNMIASLKSSGGELPWNLYLKRLMGTVESHKKKTITRRNRRQPDRLDLRGELRSHKANVAVALDISGSISDEEFYQAIEEVLNMVKHNNQDITLIECDSEIRRVYTVKSIKDVQERMEIRGSTRFTPVFEYANQHKVNLLIYFTDGQGEERLQTIPRGYKTLWVISGRGDRLSVKEAYGTVKKLKHIEIKEDNITMSDVKREGFSMNDQEGMYI